MVRKHIILIVLLSLINFSYCQIDNNGNLVSFRCDIVRPVFSHPEELPIFSKENYRNDMEKFYEFIRANLIYPETAKADKIEGKVSVQFWIDTLGYTTEHRIIEGVRQDLDDETLRVAKLIKFDVPAKNQGKPVGMCFSFPVRFTLEKVKPSRSSIERPANAKPKPKKVKGTSKSGT
ncbi:MAG: energy transducer TonB [Bacteroidetes bacterium]|nr:energy transducer TonB [Bacteroidota bacterium]MCL1968353.1 energy transducer TonB [Bacteroidota bacterium]